jgi:serine/threonine protein kinase
MSTETEILLHLFEPGQVVGEEFRLLSHLGNGPSSSVWKGVRPDDEARFCTLKFYNTGIETATAFLELLEREFDSFVIKNPHVISPVRMGRHESLLYTVSPYQEGRSLQSLLETHAKRFVGKEARVLLLFQRVMKSVVWLHKLNHSHLDLTPSNLLLVQPDRVVMTDFGLNRILRNVAGLVGGPNNIVHTAYASPQRFVRASGCTADDVFSIGVMLHEFATGEKPWGGRGGRDLIEGKGLPHLPEGQYSRHFTDLLADCLSEDPADRPDASDLEQRIQRLVNETPDVVQKTVPRPAAPLLQTVAAPGGNITGDIDPVIAQHKAEIDELRQQLARERERAQELAEKARLDLQAQLDAVRLRMECDAEAKIEAARRQTAMEAQKRIEAEKARSEREAQARIEIEKKRSEEEAQARIEIEKKRSEEEAQARIDAARLSSVEAVAEHIEQARRIVAEEMQARVKQELDTLHSKERKRREAEEMQRVAEEETLRQTRAAEALIAQRRQDQNERTIRELKDILKAEIGARQLAENKLREMGDLRSAVEHERAAKERQETAARVQLEVALQRNSDDATAHDATPSTRPSSSRERQALLEWLKQSLREELEQDLLQSVRSVLAGTSPSASGTPESSELDRREVDVSEKNRAATAATIPSAPHEEQGRTEPARVDNSIEADATLADMLAEIESRFQRDPLIFLRANSGARNESLQKKG